MAALEIADKPVGLTAAALDVAAQYVAGRFPCFPGIAAHDHQRGDVHIGVIERIIALAVKAVFLLGIVGAEELHIDFPGVPFRLHRPFAAALDAQIVVFVIAGAAEEGHILQQADAVVMALHDVEERHAHHLFRLPRAGHGEPVAGAPCAVDHVAREEYEVVFVPAQLVNGVVAGLEELKVAHLREGEGLSLLRRGVEIVNFALDAQPVRVREGDAVIDALAGMQAADVRHELHDLDFGVVL